VSAYNLAIASARAGKRTLLVEADLRSPSQANSLKVSPDADSVIEPLRYYGQFGDCIRLVPDVENLYIVPSTGPQRQAAAILESSEMRRLLEDVRGRFDMVILDTPSLSLCNDALLLEPYSDGMILVTRPGFTEDSLLAEATDQLAESDFRLLGAIINGVDIPVQSVEPLEDDELIAQTLDEPDAADLEEVATGARDYR
jgi:capsular exopolysaccharide synthesis family protein